MITAPTSASGQRGQQLLAIGDTDTGLNWISDGNLAVYTNNVERLRITSGGNVGIGTTDPTRSLDVQYTATQANTEFLLGGFSQAGTAAGVYLGYDTGAAGTDQRGVVRSARFPLAIGTSGNPQAIYISYLGSNVAVNGTLQPTNINLSGVTRSTWPFSACATRSAAGSTINHDQYATCTASCNSDEFATGGGYFWPHEYVLYKTALRDFHILTNVPGGDPPNSWTVGAYNGSATDGFYLMCYAVCCKK